MGCSVSYPGCRANSSAETTNRSGCRYVNGGHSERRHKLGETDAFINRKVKAGLGAGLTVILCVGETLEDRDANRTDAVLDTQLTGGLAGLPDLRLLLGDLAFLGFAQLRIGKRMHASPLLLHRQGAQHDPGLGRGWRGSLG